MKIAVIGSEDPVKKRLINNLAKNSTNVKFTGMNSGIDIGYTIVNGKRVYLFGGSADERKRFFEEIIPAGIDLGIVVVDSKRGLTNDDKDVIEEVKGQMPCMVFFNDREQKELHSFGRNIVHGSADSGVSMARLLEYLSKMA